MSFQQPVHGLKSAHTAGIVSSCGRAVVVALLLAVAASAALAQGATGGLTAIVKDSSGGVLPGATVILISETKGTRSVPQVTNEIGEFRFPNLSPDTYTIQVELPPTFKTLKRTGVSVSPGP